MDLDIAYQIIVAGHVIGTILGVGGATVAEFQIAKAIKDKSVTADERALMHVNYKLIRLGMMVVLVSVIAMIWYYVTIGDMWIFTYEKLWIKDIMFLTIFVNALAIERRWVPLWLGASISFTSWWGATLLGLAGRDLDLSFTTYLIGYIVAIIVMAGLLHVIRWYIGRSGSTPTPPQPPRTPPMQAGR